jgi:hypothetical protein
MAVAFDNPIPGWRTPTVTNLRLWDAEPLTEFDLQAFNAGEYEAVSLNLRAGWPGGVLFTAHGQLRKSPCFRGLARAGAGRRSASPNLARLPQRSPPPPT